MKFSRFIVLSTIISLVSGAYLSGAETKKHSRKKAPAAAVAAKAHDVITGKDAFTDYTQEKPGVFRKITVADLPEPFATESIDHGPRVVSRPSGAWPQALPGFKVELYASGLQNPRLIRTAPNGDIFLAESKPRFASGNVKVFRGVTADGKAEKMEVFATGLKQPFGIAFYPPGPDPQWVYIGNTDSVIRFPYHNGDLKASGPKQVIVPDLPSGGLLRGGGHWTRDIAFSRDGKKMYVSVGSKSNKDDTDGNSSERRRADILEYNPDGTGFRIYAYGIRNAVGIAVQPETGELWGSVNERDTLGDDLVPDYITHIQDGGFYGWPWYYIGGHYDPEHKGKHPELKDKVITPDVLLQPHFASLEMVFYEAGQFPAEYHGDVFAAEHGSWNRHKRSGYEVIRVPLNNGKATGAYEDFLTGFTLDDGDVWGRPVGVAVGNDGSLFVTDDGSNSIWRVSYTGK
ncbi:MAG TPA: sorbosone dehydrogenase family protein [Terriglobales bacterium]|jgi:glucose/arabinose dehydrogenase|nr:sorbosone dehydrogenase family protein [Terriglobales bacterium]